MKECLCYHGKHLVVTATHWRSDDSYIDKPLKVTNYMIAVTDWLKLCAYVPARVTVLLLYIF